MPAAAADERLDVCRASRNISDDNWANVLVQWQKSEAELRAEIKKLQNENEALRAEKK
jgi:hypothetical protein